MLATRVIPVLLLHHAGLVKGTQFKNHKYVGDPINAVKIFNDKAVDELVFFDISATNESRKPNFELLSVIASQSFMPFGYGGGISTLQDIERLFRIGVEKVILNTAAANDFSIVSEASNIAGSQSIVVSLDVRKNILGKYHLYTYSGRRKTHVEPIEFAKRAEDAGAGELIVCSIDHEGTEQGYDNDFIKQISSAVTIPVVASGGAGKLSDFKTAIIAGASAVAAGNIFIFHGKHKAVLITYPQYSSLENLFGRNLHA